jgi:hypothetical protein
VRTDRDLVPVCPALELSDVALRHVQVNDQRRSVELVNRGAGQGEVLKGQASLFLSLRVTDIGTVEFLTRFFLSFIVVPTTREEIFAHNVRGRNPPGLCRCAI